MMNLKWNLWMYIEDGIVDDIEVCGEVCWLCFDVELLFFLKVWKSIRVWIL